MNDDTRDLVVRLCTQVGAIMEDASVLAVTSAALDTPQLRSLVIDLVATIDEMRAIAGAAATLANNRA